jgi:hypothetical protein
MQSFFVQKKTLILEILILVLFLGGIYYLYTIMREGGSVTVQGEVSEQLLGQNFVLFLKIVNQDKISFREADFLNSDLVQRLRDFSETILPTDSRGRADPFVPYASTRPLR